MKTGNSQIVGLSPAAGENHLGRVGTDEGRDLFTCPFNRLPRDTTVPVQA